MKTPKDNKILELQHYKINMAKEYPEIPEWFKLENYEIYNDLSSKNIGIELAFRQAQLLYVKDKSSFESHEDEIRIINSLNLVRKKGVAVESYHQINVPYTIVPVPKNTLKIEKVYIRNTKTNDEFKSPNLMLSSITELSFDEVYNYLLVSKPLLDVYLIPELYLEYNTRITVLMTKYDKSDKVNLATKGNINKILKTFKGKVNKEFNKYKENDFSEKVFPAKANTYKSAQHFLSNFNKMFKGTLFEKYLNIQNNNLYVKVDLGSTDEMIHEELQSKIESHRELLSLEPIDNILVKKAKDKRSGILQIKKSIIDLRILQYIDLYIWEVQNKFDLTDEWFINSIYSDKKTKGIEIAHNKIYDTVRPLARKCLDMEWLRAFNSCDV